MREDFAINFLRKRKKGTLNEQHTHTHTHTHSLSLSLSLSLFLSLARKKYKIIVYARNGGFLIEEK